MIASFIHTAILLIITITAEEALPAQSNLQKCLHAKNGNEYLDRRGLPVPYTVVDDMLRL